MSLPKTRLLVAPSDALDPFGNGMHSSDLLKGLRRISLNFNMPLPEHYSHWYPGAVFDMTTLWYGRPHDKDSKKICAIKLGVIPEFTQVDSDGYIIDYGWRALLRRCVRAKVATKYAIERQFSISLDEDAVDPDCPQCLQDGIRGVKAEHKSGMCDTHETVRINVAEHKEHQDEQEWLKSHPQPDVGRVYVS